MLKNENNAQELQDFDFETLMYKMPETLLGEFLEPRGNDHLIKGLDAMFQNYFKQNRYFPAEDTTTAVLEAYHFCSHFLTNKELFNLKIVA